MTFDYNSTRPKLILAEYGRNVQNMVNHICTIENREERIRLAQIVIDMMGALNPHLRDVNDFKHKLWDHLFIISDFKIDVESPYPIPDHDVMHKKPNKIPYPQHNIRFKHYGHLAEQMISKALELENSEHRNAMALSIANFMKMAYLSWNKDSVQDDHIIQDLEILSKGELTLPKDTVLSRVDVKSMPAGNRGKTTNGTPQNNNHNNQKNNAPKKPMMKRKTVGGASNNNNSNYKRKTK